MRRVVFTGLLSALLASNALAAEDIVGRWDLQVEPGGYVSWIGVTKEGGAHKVQFLWMGGGVENPPEKAKVEGNTVSFRARDMNWVGTAKGDEITGTATEDNGHVNKFTGRRYVPDIDVSGKWKVELEEAANAQRSATLTLKQSGSTVTGTYNANREVAIEDGKLEGDTLTFKLKARRTGAPLEYKLQVKGDVLEGSFKPRNKERKLTARRERQWGTPIELFNGRNLDGWKPLGDPKSSKWHVVDSVLTNADRGANLVTEKSFRDFKLHVEFKVPSHSNSGVYLRGRYEIQVEDSFGKQASGGSCGALYSRIVPKENASRPPNEWQTFDITLIGQYLTLEHNGKKVIDNQEVAGVTGGAIDSKEHEPGPIYIQGDHGSVEYRKITLTPALPVESK